MSALPGSFASVMHRMPGWATPAQAAVELAHVGVPVFPVGEDKRPLTRHGFRDAVTDRQPIERWWQRFPQAGLAIPTGLPSGVVVVDVDVHGVNGYEALARAGQRHFLDGWELAIDTPSGGRHLYFPASPDGPQACWQAAKAGIDFRGDGGYIVIPPTSRTIDGERTPYRVIDFARGRAVPLEVERLRNFLDPRPVTLPKVAVSYAPDEVTRLAGWVSRLHEGERNHGLFWAACKMAEHGVATTDALDALTAAGGQAGLSEREVATTVRSAFRTVTGFLPSTPNETARRWEARTPSISAPVRTF